MSNQVLSPVVDGSGVMVVHRMLEANLPHYHVQSLSPYWGVFPPVLGLRERTLAPVVHSLPELGTSMLGAESDLVATFHNYYLDDDHLATASVSQRMFYRSVVSRMVSSSVRRARWLTAVSHYTADLVRKQHKVGDRLVVIPNGVDTTAFAPLGRPASDEVRILFAGNPTRRKGIDHLLALAEQLPANARILYTVGLRDSAIEQPAASPRLVPVPRRTHRQMAELYQSVDILFFPTRREGFGLVAAEAMACGLPVVATDCSSLPELITHDRGGFLFEPDNRQQMLEYLLRLVRDPALRAEMGAYNRERAVSRFGLESMLAGYRQVFEACNKAA